MKSQVMKNFVNEKSKVWEKIEIVIEPAIQKSEADAIIHELVSEIKDLLKENMNEIEESRKLSS